MKPPPRSQGLRVIASRLGELLDSPAGVSGPRSGEAGAELRVGRHVFLVEWRAAGDVAGVAAGVRQLAARRKGARDGRIPLLAVPFMGETGRRLCADSSMSWLDLSGNACIDARGLRIRVEGRLNRFTRRGRPSDPFAPKSARIARWLLQHPDEFHQQKEMAMAVGMGAGFTSRVVGRLEDLGLVERNEHGAVRAHDPRLLFEAWAERYDFERHHVIRGNVAARSGEELLSRLSSAFSAAGVEHAATGLAGAWLLAHFASFRLVTCYVAELPGLDLLAGIGFQADERGANLWLAMPKDEGVFQGMDLRDGIPCASPVQVLLDLRTHPERSSEAAGRLEETLLAWRPRD